jgi:hypothetical protein
VQWHRRVGAGIGRTLQMTPADNLAPLLPRGPKNAASLAPRGCHVSPQLGVHVRLGLRRPMRDTTVDTIWRVGHNGSHSSERQPPRRCRGLASTCTRAAGILLKDRAWKVELTVPNEAVTDRGRELPRRHKSRWNRPTQPDGSATTARTHRSGNPPGGAGDLLQRAPAPPGSC